MKPEDKIEGIVLVYLSELHTYVGRRIKSRAEMSAIEYKMYVVGAYMIRDMLQFYNKKV